MELPKLWAPGPQLGYAHDSNYEGRVLIVEVKPADPYPCLTVRPLDFRGYWPPLNVALQETQHHLQRASELVPLGLFRHYKGHHYLTLGCGLDLEHTRRIVVVYVPLEFGPTTTGPRLAIRSWEDFLANVDAKGEACRPDAPGCQPRFAYLGPAAEAKPS